MKKARIIIMLVLTACICAALCIFAGAESYSGKCGENVSFTLNEEGTLILSGTGDMYDFRQNMPWEEYRDRINSVVIGSGVTSIGEEAFVFCDNLKSVELCDGLKTIKNAAFWYCTALEKIVLPDSVTTVEDNIFGWCESLTEAKLSASIQTVPHQMFANCEQLKAITIPDSVVTIGEYAFNGCRSLKSVSLSNNLTSLARNAFSVCKSLQNVTFPDSLESIGEEAFIYCDSLRQVIFGKNLKQIGTAAFDNCRSLVSVKLGGGIKTIGASAFRGCSGLTNLKISTGVQTIGQFAFSSCSSLTSVSIPGSVRTLGTGAFDGCAGLTSVTVNVSVIPERAFWNVYNLSEVRFGKNVTRICQNAFDGCNYLQKAIFDGDCPKTDYLALPYSVQIYCHRDAEGWTVPWWNGYYCYYLEQEEEQTNKLTLMANDGTNQAYTVPHNLLASFIPKRAGYVFSGWYANKSCTGEPVSILRVLFSNATLYAKWTKLSANFDVKQHAFPFTNEGYFFCSNTYSPANQNDYHYDIRDTDYYLLYNSADNASKKRIEKEKQEVWGGSCFGISAVSVLSSLGKINLEPYYTPTDAAPKPTHTVTASDLHLDPQPCSKAESLINYYYLAQQAEPYFSLRGQYDKKSESNNLKRVVQTMRSVPDQPVLMNINLTDANGKLSGHSVVAYDFTVVSETADAGAYTMKIYDCNTMPLIFDNQTPENTLSLSIFMGRTGDRTESWYKVGTKWENSYIARGYTGIFVKNVMTADDLLGLSVRLQEQQTALTLDTLCADFTLSCGQQTLLVQNGEPVGEDPLGAEIYEDEDGLHVVIAEPSEEAYCFAPADGQALTLTVSLTDSFSFDAEAADPVSVTFDRSGCVRTLSRSVCRQTVSFADDLYDLGCDFFEVTCETSGLSFTRRDAVMEIAASEQTAACITAYNSLQQSSETVWLDNEAVQLFKSWYSAGGCMLMRNGCELALLSRQCGLVFDSGEDSRTVFVQWGSVFYELPQPEREGYVFVCWIDSERGTRFSGGTVTEDMLLTAVWDHDESAWKTLTFCAEGCSDQTIVVPVGTTLQREQLPLSDTLFGMRIEWDEEEIAALCSEPITSSATIYGEPQMLADGSAVQISSMERRGEELLVTMKNETAAEQSVRLLVTLTDRNGRMQLCRLICAELSPLEQSVLTVSDLQIGQNAVVSAMLLSDERMIPVSDKILLA